ncbi:thermonuclease family protein [Qipengyuania marisflavi]|uniref:TNase-like domain-containing protein n=1 Tax=Qipengyuania marisflavi TaxID=2486356 RepID=A0A5S3P5X2_9SPHN|nr:thermonuclease family protein [Qipengyuania marisflavi]TMM48437.1 hypothetical protein FEV51_09205 [Qipengyuania marisflavi]
MGKIVRFDKSRRRRTSKWTRAQDYGGPPRPPRKDGGGPGWLGALRPLFFLVLLCAAWVLYENPELVGAPDLLATEPEVVDASWTRCGPGRGQHCVIDGDTFKIGAAKFRIMSVDAPEVDARCPAEKQAAETATQGLQDWLNAGAFTMQGRWDEPTDRYGRGLRELYRTSNGSRQWLGDALVEQGLVRRYYGGTRQSWCATD